MSTGERGQGLLVAQEDRKEAKSWGVEVQVAILRTLVCSQG